MNKVVNFATRVSNFAFLGYNCHMTPICDYLTVSQVHSGRLPVIGAGTETRTDFVSGEVRHRTLPLQVSGDFGTSMRLACDGSRVVLSGNIGRFNRPDNVSGYSLEDCKALANAFLASFDLPPFSAGEFVQLSSGFTYTGATFSRLDTALTSALGSPSKAFAWLDSMRCSKFPRLEKFIYPTSVYHGKNSKSRKYRMYDKALEHQANAGEFFNSDLFSFLRDSGVVRIERQAHSFLRRARVRAWHLATDENVNSAFFKEVKSFMKNFDVADFDDVPTKYLGTLTMALSGIDPKDRLSRRTYYEHRKALLALGYDISLGNLTRIKRTVVEFEHQIIPPLKLADRG